MGKKGISVITYNGVDGACAAAMVLLKHANASVLISSASRIGKTLSELSTEETPPAEVHICGVGVYCDWSDVEQPIAKLKMKGSHLTWYCGRGYLALEKFSKVCTPAFYSVDTNTEAVCKHLEMGDAPVAESLLALAKRDPQINKGKGQPSIEEKFWRDYIEASVSQYFKFNDTEAYSKAIHKLSRGAYENSDKVLVEVFRKTGYKYTLEGNSKQIRDLKRKIAVFGEIDEPVIITGESGVGKEYVAHLIHERSARAMELFMPVNCAMFIGNTELANSMLFGHLKGAFTGALKDRQGAFVAADGGILFLDEIGEMPLEVQAKLLRVLEDGWITPEGADKPTKHVNVRLVVATNRDLVGMVRKKELRSDLYHRLDTLRLPVPPLRDHTEDIVAIASKTLELLLEKSHLWQFTAQDIQLLRAYEWPGNVRQLIKLLKRVAFMKISVAEALEEERRLAVCPDSNEKETGSLLPRTVIEIRPIDEIKCEYAKRALELNGGVLHKTAKMLGMSVNTLKKILGG